MSSIYAGSEYFTLKYIWLQFLNERWQKKDKPSKDLFLIVRYYIWKDLTSAVVLVKLPRIFRTQMKWCNNSKNDRVTIFIEIILWRICPERIQVKCFYPVEILTHTTFSPPVSISWVIFHFYTYLMEYLFHFYTYPYFLQCVHVTFLFRKVRHKLLSILSGYNYNITICLNSKETHLRKDKWAVKLVREPRSPDTLSMSPLLWPLPLRTRACDTQVEAGCW